MSWTASMEGAGRIASKEGARSEVEQGGFVSKGTRLAFRKERDGFMTSTTKRGTFESEVSIACRGGISAFKFFLS